MVICAWSGGRWDEAGGLPHLGFFVLYLPALWPALSCRNRLVHHLAVLALVWLALLLEGLDEQPVPLRQDFAKNCRVVVITDRTDLEAQLSKTFASSGAISIWISLMLWRHRVNG